MMNRLRLTRAIVLAVALVTVPAFRAHAQGSLASAPAVDSIATVDVTELPTPPGIVDRDRVARAVVRAWMDAGQANGVVMLFFLVDERGVPMEVEVSESSGSAALDSRAMQVGRRMRFSPSTLDGKPVRVRMQMPFTFGETPPQP